MNLSRKDFMKISGGTLGALAISPLTNKLNINEDSRKLKTFGLQLYSIRDVFEKDPPGAIKMIASFGYKQLEGYERAAGIFWGMKNTEFKKFVEDLGMVFISSHCDIYKDFKKKADEAAAIEMKYLLSSSYGRKKTMDDYKKMAAEFNRCGEICKQAGTRFAFHAEDHEYLVLDGISPMETLLSETDPGIVDFEMDFYWAIIGGQDPQQLLKRHPRRFRLCHIKDRTPGTTKREDTCDLGTGSIDFTPILKTARKNGMQYYIAEQEHYPVSSMQSVAADARYMKTLRV